MEKIKILNEIQNEIINAENILTTKKNNSMNGESHITKSCVHNDTSYQNLNLDSDININSYDELISRLQLIEQIASRCIDYHEMKHYKNRHGD